MEVYLDHAATTYTLPEVLEAMLPYFSEIYGNPSSKHEEGLKAKQAVDKSRKTIADILNCQLSEIIFCGTGTEANNIAIIGTARANKEKGKHIITTKIEHASILKPLEYLEKNEEFHISYINVNKEGLIDLNEFEKSITPETTLASIIYANNEIGTIQNIKEIAKICQKHGVLLHTDACQASSYLSLNTKELGIDLMTINGSKCYGPKGIGALYIKEGTKIEALTLGGGQENGLRSGTLNTPAIIGLAKALELAEKNKALEYKRISALRDKLLEGILKNIKKSTLNGSKEQRLPNNINICIPGIDSKELLLKLDSVGIYCSSSSACKSQNTESSHVLRAIGLSEESAQSSIRLTLGHNNTDSEIDYCIDKFKVILL